MGGILIGYCSTTRMPSTLPICQNGMLASSKKKYNELVRLQRTKS
jgi:hypothetical protein